jgi:AcrR family transcriptional regulator
VKTKKRLTRDQKRERTRKELLDAAGRVFARRGYRAASLDEVADEAGYSKGAVYSNFDSKEELFLTLIQEHMREHLEGANAAFSTGETLIERLQSGSDYLAKVVEQDREWCLLVMEFWGQAVRDPQLREVFAADYESWRHSIAELIETQSVELGLPLSAPPAELASAIIAFYEGFVLQKMIDPDRFERGFIGRGLLTFAAGVAALAGADVERLLGPASGER